MASAPALPNPNTVVQHPQALRDTEGRDHLAPVAPDLSEEVEGEVVVTVDQLLLLFGQRDALNRIVCLSRYCECHQQGHH